MKISNELVGFRHLDGSGLNRLPDIEGVYSGIRLPKVKISRGVEYRDTRSLGHRIALIYTGGTLGMMRNANGGLAPAASDKEFQRATAPTLKKLSGALKLPIDYVFFHNVDSVNMAPNAVRALSDLCFKLQSEGYAAIGILHGTDSLSITSARLALALGGDSPKRSVLKIPIVITGAQTSIHDSPTDAQFNLAAMLKLAKLSIERGICDVLVNFEKIAVLGCRALKTQEHGFDAFTSTKEVGIVGHFDSRGPQLSMERIRHIGNAETNLPYNSPNFEVRITSLNTTTSTRPETLLRNADPTKEAALILSTMGEGNVTYQGSFDLISTIREIVRTRRVPVLTATSFAGGSVGDDSYEAGEKVRKAGAIPCGDLSLFGTHVKAGHALGNNRFVSMGDFARYMTTNMVGELS